MPCAKRRDRRDRYGTCLFQLPGDKHEKFTGGGKGIAPVGGVGGRGMVTESMSDDGTEALGVLGPSSYIFPPYF